jgi:septal ring-binding cell division protein DamX
MMAATAPAPEAVAMTETRASPEAAQGPGATVPVNESRLSSESTITSELPAKAAIAENDTYVLQVGAFRTQESALLAVDEIGLEELRVIPTRRGDKDWYVLVLGAYNSHVDAREAGQAYLRAYPRGSIWVRSVGDLKESLVNR